jgi:hypothetical protein
MIWVEASDWLGGDSMGRRKRTRLFIKDVKVKEGKCIVSVEIRRGSNVWNKAYGFDAKLLKNWDFEAFKNKILQDALKLDDDKRFEERVLIRIEHMIDQEIYLD